MTMHTRQMNKTVLLLFVIFILACLETMGSSIIRLISRMHRISNGMKRISSGSTTFLPLPVAAASASSTASIHNHHNHLHSTAAWICNYQQQRRRRHGRNFYTTCRRRPCAFVSGAGRCSPSSSSSPAFYQTTTNTLLKKSTTERRSSSSSSDSTAAVTATTNVVETTITSTTTTHPSTTTLVAPPKFVPYPFEYRQEVELRIETLTNRGWGIGRIPVSNKSPAGQHILATAEESSGNNSKQRRNRRRRRRKSQEKHEAQEKEESEYIQSLLDNESSTSSSRTNGAASDENNENDVVVKNEQQRRRPSSSWVVMVVPGVIPGELVKARVYRNFKSYSHADLVSVIEASPDRVTPACPLFTGSAGSSTTIDSDSSAPAENNNDNNSGSGGSSGGDCGGCQLQHMNIGLQRYWKTRHVVEGLRQHGFTTASMRMPMNDAPSSSKTTSYSPLSTLDVHDKDDCLLVSPCLGTDKTYGYRSKLTPHYDQPRKSRRGRQQVQQDDDDSDSDTDANDDDQAKRITAIGFQRQSMRQIVDVPNCPIATPAINTAYHDLRQDLLSQRLGVDDADASDGDNDSTSSRKQARSKKATNNKQPKGATLLLRQGNLQDAHIETNSRAFLTTTVRGLNFTYRAGNFFQNNYYILPIMVEHVIQAALHGGRCEQKEGTPSLQYLVDCYCGSGLFAISAAQRMKRVAGIEINDKAILEASSNAAANNITNCVFVCATAEKIFESLETHKTEDDVDDADSSVFFDPDQTVVILDPPRKGCSVDFLEQLRRYGPARVVYVSCDPSTQARDAAILVGNKQQQQQQQESSSARSNNNNNKGKVQDDTSGDDAVYRITSIQPMDLFPQTRHIECVMVFERSDR